MRFEKLILSLLLLSLMSCLFGQEKDTSEVIFGWKLINNFQERKIVPVDTSLNSAHITIPLYRNSNSTFSYLGNNGAAAINNVFILRNNENDFPFIGRYAEYMHRSENTTYYNAKIPFSEFYYSTLNGNRDLNEQTVGIMHTQNAGGNLNLGLDFDYIGGKGLYKNQRTKDAAFTLFSRLDQGRYTSNASININKFVVEHNYGILNKEELETATEAVSVRNESANSEIRYYDFLYTHRYDFKKLVDSLSNDSVKVFDNKIPYFSLYQSLNYKIGKHFFYDETLNDSKREYLDSIANVIYNRERTTDSTAFFSVSNEIGFSFNYRKNRFKTYFYGGLYSEYQRFISGVDTSQSDTIYYLKSESAKYLNNSIRGGYNGKLGAVSLNAFAESFFTGYKVGDLELNVNGKIDLTEYRDYLPYLDFNWKFESNQPGYFYNKYISNYRQWNTNFRKTITNSLGADMGFESLKNEIGFNISNLGNYVYLNDSAYPEQKNRTVNLLTVYIKQKFNLWKIHSDNSVYWQKSEDADLLGIPEWSVFSSLYFDHTFHFDFTGGHLQVQLGGEFRYNDLFYSKFFAPAVEQFYFNDVYKLGDYYYLDLFFKARVKQLKFFVVYSHINEFWQSSYDYFKVPEYPLNPATLKLGVHWNFYY